MVRDFLRRVEAGQGVTQSSPRSRDEDCATCSAKSGCRCKVAREGIVFQFPLYHYRHMTRCLVMFSCLRARAPRSPVVRLVFSRFVSASQFSSQYKHTNNIGIEVSIRAPSYIALSIALLNSRLRGPGAELVSSIEGRTVKSMHVTSLLLLPFLAPLAATYVISSPDHALLQPPSPLVERCSPSTVNACNDDNVGEGRQVDAMTMKRGKDRTTRDFPNKVRLCRAAIVLSFKLSPPLEPPDHLDPTWRETT